MTVTYPNALYALLGAISFATSADAGRSILPLGPHLRHRGGVRIAALGLAAEQGTAVFALTDTAAVPVTISMSQRHIPEDLAELEIVTTMRHKGRSIMVSSAEAFAPGDRSQRLAFGTLTWSVLASTGATGAVAVGGVTSAEGDLAELAGITIDDGRFVIADVRPDTGGPGGVLHAGALQALAEAAALGAVHDRGSDGARAVVTDAAFHFLRAARTGPFVAKVRPFGHDTEVSIVEAGGSGRVAAIATCTVDTAAG